jgi:hypothetical protein
MRARAWRGALDAVLAPTPALIVDAAFAAALAPRTMRVAVLGLAPPLLVTARVVCFRPLPRFVVAEILRVVTFRFDPRFAETTFTGLEVERFAVAGVAARFAVAGVAARFAVAGVAARFAVAGVAARFAVAALAALVFRAVIADFTATLVLGFLATLFLEAAPLFTAALLTDALFARTGAVFRVPVAALLVAGFFETRFAAAGFFAAAGLFAAAGFFAADWETPLFTPFAPRGLATPTACADAGAVLISLPAVPAELLDAGVELARFWATTALPSILDLAVSGLLAEATLDDFAPLPVFAGAAGVPGFTGITGVAGAPIFSGAAGAAGLIGLAGTPGLAGLAGKPGPIILAGVAVTPSVALGSIW